MAEKVIKGSEVPKDFKHTGDLRIEGNIPSGTIIDIKDGGLLVNGSLGDGVKITQKQKNNGSISIGSISQSGSGLSIANVQGNVTITVDGKTTTINGKKLDEISGTDKNASKLNGIEITGNVGNKADINGSAVNIKGNIADEPKIKSGDSIEIGGRVGNNPVFNAGNSITVNSSVGNNINFTAGDGIEIGGKVGSNPRIKAGDGVEIRGDEVSSNTIKKDILVASATGLLKSGVGQPAHVSDHTGSGGVPRNTGKIELT